MKIFSCSLSFPYSESTTRLNAFRTLPFVPQLITPKGNIMTGRYYRTLGNETIGTIGLWSVQPTNMRMVPLLAFIGNEEGSYLLGMLTIDMVPLLALIGVGPFRGYL
jgi:hypothetical protein